MLPWDGDAEQAGAMQIPVILGREFCFAIIGRCAAREHILPKLARGGDDRRLLVAQPKRLRIEDRRIQIDLVDISHGLIGLHRHHAVTCVGFALAFTKESSAAVNAPGHSTLAREPTTFTYTYFL